MEGHGESVKNEIEVMSFCCQIAGMATLTIRNLPDELHETLKLRAKRNRRSLNQEVIAELASASGAVMEGDAERKRVRAEEMIGMVKDLRSRMTHFMTAEEIDAAKREGRA